MSQEFLDHLKEHGIITHRTPPYTPQHNGVSERRNRTLLDMVRSMMSQTTLSKSFWYYVLETVARILNMVPTKKVEKTTYERIVVLLLKKQSLEDLEIIQEEDTHPSIDTSLNHEEDDLEIDEPQSDIISIRRSIRTRYASDRVCLYINAEEHELRDLGEPANYKAALLDPDEGIHSTYGVDYKETFSPVADIRAIKILIAIAAYYDYEIWKMDVKTTFLNGHLLEEVYMEKPEGKAAYILGIKIYKDRSWRLIGLCQSAYIEKILKRFHMENSKRGSIPMQEKLRLSKSQGASTPAELKRMQNVLYALAVSFIMYAMRCTRLDVAFAQNITSQFQQNPSDFHWTTVKNILKYLKNTKDMFLVYEDDIKRELKVSCYTDAGNLTDADDLKSQTRYVLVLNGGVVDWKSTKQSIFVASSTEAEYIAAYDASKEAIWVGKFIFRLGVIPIIEEPINMYCDNTGAISITNESRITKGARHLHAKVRYLRKVIEHGDIKLEKVHTYDNLADPFTKELAFPKYSEHTNNIRMLS
nr:hypothetical protein [Tanacetum cinerariifolium]